MPTMRRPIETTLLFCIILASAAVSIVLTRISCYATICPEEHFSFETTVHIAVYYGTLAIVGMALLLRTHITSVRSLMGTHLAGRIPLLGRRVTLGGFLVAIWVVGLTGGVTAFWLPTLLDFWETRTDPVNWLSAKIKLTISSVTGHHADILFGLLLIPTSRFSLVGRALDLHPSTLLFAHKTISYLFAIATFAHGGAYLSYALDGSSDGDKAREEALATGNPIMTLSESKERSEWFTQTTYTGIAILLPLIIILLTSLPWVRRNHYNFFYYSHVLLGTAILVGGCVHASTDFYLAVPAIIFWLLDRAYRIWSQMNDKNAVACVEHDGKDWIRITLNVVTRQSSIPTSEKEAFTSDPLQFYYLNFPAVSKLQGHAFTAAIPATAHTGPKFLLQPPGGRTQKRLKKEWTWKVGALAPCSPNSTSLNAVSVQGPYGVNDDGYKTASHIVCIVGGTGVTGACSLVHWWLKTGSQDTFLSVVWTIRERESANVQEWNDLISEGQSHSNLSLTLHVSAESGRLDPYEILQNDLTLGGAGSTACSRAWIYASGPDGLLGATEKACVKVQRDLKRPSLTKPWSVQNISWYIARWDV